MKDREKSSQENECNGCIATCVFSSSDLGGSSTHLQMLSAESRNYFRNAIVMSGSALHYWALSSLPTHTSLAFDLASSWGKPQTNLAELVDLLKSVPAEQFIDISVFKLGTTVELIFAPIVEGK